MVSTLRLGRACGLAIINLNASNLGTTAAAMRSIVRFGEVPYLLFGRQTSVRIEGGRITCICQRKASTIYSNFDHLALEDVLEEGEVLIRMLPALLRSTSGYMPGLIIKDETGQRIVTPSDINASIPDWLKGIVGEVIATTEFGCFLLPTEVICEGNVINLPELTNPTLVASPDTQNHTSVCVSEHGVYYVAIGRYP